MFPFIKHACSSISEIKHVVSFIHNKQSRHIILYLLIFPLLAIGFAVGNPNIKAIHSILVE